MNQKNNARSYVLALAVTVGLFPMWGLMHRINDALSPHFSALFALSSQQTSLTGSVT